MLEDDKLKSISKELNIPIRQDGQEISQKSVQEGAKKELEGKEQG